MTQHKSERKHSNFQILADVKKIRNSIVSLCLRDFGVKSRSRSPEFYARVYKMDESDGASFVKLLNKYDVCSQILDEYPQWYIDELRTALIKTAFELVRCVEISNIYPVTLFECNLRREYQDKALACLFDLYQWLDLAAISLPLDKTKFVSYCEDIEKAIASIKSLRKSDNALRYKIKDKEKHEIVEALCELLEIDYNISSKMLDKVLECIIRMHPKRDEGLS